MRDSFYKFLSDNRKFYKIKMVIGKTFGENTIMLIAGVVFPSNFESFSAIGKFKIGDLLTYALTWLSI